jgi:hypothetical protein
MRKRAIQGSILAFAVFSILFGAMAVLQPAVAGGATCATKHCSSGTHCCISCTGSPFCVKNGIPCPECAPQ